MGFGNVEERMYDRSQFVTSTNSSTGNLHTLRIMHYACTPGQLTSFNFYFVKYSTHFGIYNALPYYIHCV